MEGERMGWWFNTPLWARVIGGLIVGTFVGLALRSAGQTAFATDVIAPFGDAFLRLIRMLVVPLIFSTLV
ncbi:MAG: cation:dicarboxylase symporter family transporter, partial [Caulobacterales bacterium]|nr:cation:dicarboxylase symporter family transporter [Caulobacterales bacterium]